MTKFMKYSFYPAIFQWMTLIFFSAVMGWLLFGPADKDNPANLLVWLIWWPMLCVLFIFAGRIWCAVCPFSLVSDLIQRVAGVGLPVPDFLRRHGCWLILTAFLLLSWLEEATGIMDSPRKTALMLMTILSGAIAFGLFLKGRAWCRYVCPIGGISLVYARASLFKIRSDEAACAECATKDCAVPDSVYSGCPMHLTPFAMDSVANCNVCGACVKRCASNALGLRFEAPSLDLSSSSVASPVIAWLVMLLSGMISFLNSLESERLPFEKLLGDTAYPVLMKTFLMSGILAAGCCLFMLLARMVEKYLDSAGSQIIRLGGALPMIPLLLFTHLGHVSSELWSDGGHLTGLLAKMLKIPMLELDWLWQSTWRLYFSPFCIMAGLAMSLFFLLRLEARRASSVKNRINLLFGIYYTIFAGYNLFAVWPVRGKVAEAVKTVTDAQETISLTPAASDPWMIIWPFLGLLTALLALALIIRKSVQSSGSMIDNEDFGATRAWLIRDSSLVTHSEILEWLLEKAIAAKWRIPAVVGLANASQEVITFLQRTVPKGTAITVNATLRKNKGIFNIFHEGSPLALPDYKGATTIDADDDALSGLELRLAASQVEYMSYQARLSGVRCSFTLRQTCKSDS